MEKHLLYFGNFKTIQRNRLPKMGVFIAHDFFGDDDSAREGYRTMFDDAFVDTNYMPLYATGELRTILDTVAPNLINAEAGIFDVSTHRRYNANVLIELGMALGLNYPIVLIAEDDGEPLLDFLEILKPLRYHKRRDLISQLPNALNETVNTDQRLSDNYCVICRQDTCSCRKLIHQQDKTFMLVGAHVEDDEVDIDVKSAVRDLKLERLIYEDGLTTDLCGWLYTMRRSRFVFFYSKPLGKSHHGAENAATMVQLGMAIGSAIPWGIIVPPGEFGPTDVSSILSIRADKNPKNFRSQLKSAAAFLLQEHNPFHGIYDPLEPPLELPIQEDDNVLADALIDDVEALDGFWNVPELPTNYMPTADIEAVQRLLSGDDRIVIIRGRAGTGKTVLAIALSHDQNIQAVFRDGIFWLRGSTFIDSDRIIDSLREILTALNYEDPSRIETIDQGRSALLRMLENRSCLFVLDGLDEIPSTSDTREIAQLFDSLSRSSERNRILITTREYTDHFDFGSDEAVTHILDENITYLAGKKIFISYSHQDAREYAEQLAMQLKQIQVDVWIDVDSIRPGENWRESLQQGISAADAYVVILTQGIVASDQLMGELTLARQYEKPIIPILLSGDEIPTDLRAIQYIDARNNPGSGFRLLIASLAERFSEQDVVINAQSLEDADIRILVVDDRDEVRQKLEVLFRSQGWDIVQARTNHEAREHIQSHAFSLVTTDILRRREFYGEEGNLGLDLVFELQDQYPVVIISSDSVEYLYELRPDLAPWGHINRNANDDEIVEAVKQVLAGNKLPTPWVNNEKKKSVGQHIFINYSRTDSDFAQRLVDDLQNAGHKVWIDTSSIVGGEDWYKAIMEGVNDSYAFVSIVSPDANESKWVQRELLYADQLGKLIIPAQAHTTDLPLSLITRQVIDFTSDYSEGLRQLIEILPNPGTSVSEISPNTDLDNFELNSQLERDTAIKLLNAGWNVDPFVLKANELTISSNARVDFLLLHDDSPLAIVEVRGPAAELERTKDRIRSFQSELDARFAYIVNGDEFIEIDRTVGLETVLHEFPQAQDLRDRSEQPIEVTLSRVFSTLNQERQYRFAQLASFDPQRILFTVADLRVLWGDEDAEILSTLEKFKQLSLINEETTGQYHFAHQLVLEYAQKLWDAMQDTGSSEATARSLRIYVSSTVRDLAEYRQRAIDTIRELGMHPIGTENFHARDMDVISVVQQLIQEADVFVGIYGHRYGFIPPSSNRSIIEIAYDFAGELGKNRLIFLADPTLTSIPNENDNEAREKIENFRARIDREVTRVTFDSLDELAVKLSQSLMSSQVDQNTVQQHTSSRESLLLSALYESSTQSDSTMKREGRARLIEELAIEGNKANLVIEATSNQITFACYLLSLEHLTDDVRECVLGQVQQKQAQEMLNYALSNNGLVVTHTIDAPSDQQSLFNRYLQIRSSITQQLEDIEWLQSIIEECAADVSISSAQQNVPSPNLQSVPSFQDSPVAPVIDLAEIPSGEFLMGQDNSSDDVQPQHRVQQDTFLISKYPITQQQFLYFVVAGGYERQQFWTDEGWQLVQRLDLANVIKTPRSGFFEQTLAQVQDGIFPLPTQSAEGSLPIVSISWYEAKAFCRWMTEITGQYHDLPHEAQWEKAARGTDGRIYPWGNEFDSTKCNTSEGRVGRITDVTRYPQGASPYAVIDMSGNGWEWTNSLYRPYYVSNTNVIRSDADKGERIAKRGGSFSNDRLAATTFSRANSRPSERNNNLGFRIVIWNFE